MAILFGNGVECLLVVGVRCQCNFDVGFCEGEGNKQNSSTEIYVPYILPKCYKLNSSNCANIVFNFHSIFFSLIAMSELELMLSGLLVDESCSNGASIC